MSLYGTLSLLTPINNKEQNPMDNNPNPTATQGPPPVVRPYVHGEVIPPGLSLVNGYLMSSKIATIMAQISYTQPTTSKKSSGDDYRIPVLAGELHSNPGAWLKNAEAALKLFQVPQPNWVPKAAKNLKGAARAWYTNWIDANINFDDWDLFKEDFLTTFTTNITELDISLQLVDI